MKISKLFHWLYATLMFLPLVFFIPSVFYYGFNEHATNTETTTINYKYESNEVNTLDDLVVGNIYHFKIENNSLDNIFDMSNDSYFYADFINVSSYDFDNYANFTLDEQIYSSYLNNGSLVSSFNVEGTYNGYLSFYLTYNTQNDYLFNFAIGQLSDNFTFEGDFILSDINIEGLYNNPFSYTDYNVIESVSVNTDDTITDKLNRSWNAIFDLPMFSWTKNTFVSDAFTNITGVFGLDAENSLNYLFGYFATISICWLVFDIVLYVPNLAHRWLDKGALD